MKTVDVHEELRVHIARKYRSQKAAAASWGVSTSFVSSVLSGKKAPTTIMLEDAGLERVRPDAVYIKAKKGTQ